MVIYSGTTDHLAKEDTAAINRYKLSVPTKIHISKNNNYLSAGLEVGWDEAGWHPGSF
jgi:hypothetical protein